MSQQKTSTVVRRHIITGCRDFADKALVERVVTDLVMRAHKNDERVVIVHGACATGADHFADEIAKRLQAQGYPVDIERHPADWSTHGLAAGPIRNSAMAALGAEECTAFWDGKSKGTLDAITQAVKKKILVTLRTA